MEQGRVQIYYGAGQGKSSAALGNAIRKAGKGGSVCVVQFMKGNFEQEFLSRLEPDIKFFRFERSDEAYDDLPEEERLDEQKNIRNGLNFAKKVLTTGECDMLVLDEIFGVIDEGIITADELLNVLNTRSLFTDIIMTGRNLPEELKVTADEIICVSKEL